MLSHFQVVTGSYERQSLDGRPFLTKMRLVRFQGHAMNKHYEDMFKFSNVNILHYQFIID